MATLRVSMCLVVGCLTACGHAPEQEQAFVCGPATAAAEQGPANGTITLLYEGDKLVATRENLVGVPQTSYVDYHYELSESAHAESVVLRQYNGWSGGGTDLFTYEDGRRATRETLHVTGTRLVESYHYDGDELSRIDIDSQGDGTVEAQIRYRYEQVGAGTLVLHEQAILSSGAISQQLTHTYATEFDGPIIDPAAATPQLAYRLLGQTEDVDGDGVVDFEIDYVYSEGGHYIARNIEKKATGAVNRILIEHDCQ